MIFKSTLIIFATNTIAHFLNYLYHFIAGRFLSPDQFGLLESFVALNYLLAVVISAFSLSIIHQLSLAKKSHQPTLINQLQTFSLKLTLVVWSITLLFFPLLKRLLHFNNPYLLFLFSLQILFSFTPTLYLSFLQAKLKFTKYSLVNLLSPLVKTLSSLILFFLGFKVSGALTGLFLASLIPAIFSYQLVKPHLPKHQQKPPLPLPPSFFKFGLTAFIVNLSLTSLYTSDVLLVRFFISHQSGLYAAASVLSKIIFFVSASVLTVTFPVFTLQTNNLNKLKTSFKNAFFLISIIAFLGVIVYQTYPHLVIKLFSSSEYTLATTLLPGFSLFIFFFTLFNLSTQLLLILNKRLAILTTLIPAIFQVILIFLFHQNLFQVITNSIITTLFGLTLSLIFILKLLYI